MSNINIIRIECLNNIAVCSYIMKDYANTLEKTREVKADLFCILIKKINFNSLNIIKLIKVLAYNPNNFNALCYKAKAYIALNKTQEALKYIKQALSIKYNKTLAKYLIDLEAKQKKISDELFLQESHIQFSSIINSSKLNSKSKNNLSFKHKNDLKKYLNLNNNFKYNSESASIEQIKCHQEIISNTNLGKDFKFNLKILNNCSLINNNFENINIVKIPKDNSNSAHINNLTFENQSIKAINNELKINSNYITWIKSNSKLIRIIKIFWMCFIQYIKKYKVIIYLLALIMIYLKRKSVISYLKKMLGVK